MADVKLLGLWYSPVNHRVEWALKIKGVQYEFIEEALQNKNPLLQSNPVHKKISVLIHKGKPICESMVIVEYIDETFEDPSILPKDPYDRALERLCNKVSAIVNTFFLKGEEQENAKKEVCETLKILDNEFKDKKFLGDNFGFADMAANLVGHWLGVFEAALSCITVKGKISKFLCLER